jgi:hypothetical protein
VALAFVSIGMQGAKSFPETGRASVSSRRRALNRLMCLLGERSGLAVAQDRDRCALAVGGAPDEPECLAGEVASCSEADEQPELPAGRGEQALPFEP